MAWTLTQNGIVTQTGTGSNFAFHEPGRHRGRDVSATVTSSDGGTGSDSAQIVVIDQNQSGATITIDSATMTIDCASGTSLRSWHFLLRARQSG